MSNIYLKVLTALTATFVFQSAIAGVQVRYACQRFIGSYKDPKFVDDVIVIQSEEIDAQLPVEMFATQFNARSCDLNFSLIRYNGFSLLDPKYESPYDALHSGNANRENMSGKKIETSRPIKSRAGTFTIREKREDGKIIQMTMNRGSMNYIQLQVLNANSIIPITIPDTFACHEPDFFETTVEEEQMNTDGSSAEFTTY